jgi:hypothetical protein
MRRGRRIQGDLFRDDFGLSLGIVIVMAVQSGRVFEYRPVNHLEIIPGHNARPPEQVTPYVHSRSILGTNNPANGLSMLSSVARF